MIKIYCIDNGELIRDYNESCKVLSEVFDVSDDDVKDIMNELMIYGVEDDIEMFGVNNVDEINLEMWLKSVGESFELNYK